MYVTSDYNTQLPSLAWLFGFVALFKALSIDWTGCVWCHEDYEDPRWLLHWNSKFMGGTMIIVLVGPHHIYAGQIGWGVGEQHKWYIGIIRRRKKAKDEVGWGRLKISKLEGTAKREKTRHISTTKIWDPRKKEWRKTSLASPTTMICFIWGWMWKCETHKIRIKCVRKTLNT